MAKFVIAPHMRLQEWVAEEKGYVAAEGLDCEFRERATRHRPAPRSPYALLQPRIPRALPGRHGHAPLGPRRAHRVRALYEGGHRGILRVDRPAPHLPRGRDGRRQIRGRRLLDPD